jgi:hypothetical protein
MIVLKFYPKGEEMTRKRFRTLVCKLVELGVVTSIEEFARLFNYANKLPKN